MEPMVLDCGGWETAGRRCGAWEATFCRGEGAMEEDWAQEPRGPCRGRGRPPSVPDSPVWEWAGRMSRSAGGGPGGALRGCLQASGPCWVHVSWRARGKSSPP